MEYKWHVMENMLDRPPATDTYIVSGFIIEDGRTRRLVRMAQYEKGNKWLDNADMVVESWTEVPRTY